MMDHVDRLARRLANAVRFAKLTLINDAGPVQRAQANYGPIDSGASLGVRDNTPVVGMFGFASNPPPGADAVMLSVRGDMGNAVVIAVNHQTYRLKNLPSGAAALYDMFGNTIVLSAAGIVLTPASGQPVIVNGDLTATGTITGQTDVKAGAEPVSLIGHEHGGVQPGSGSSGKPV